MKLLSSKFAIKTPTMGLLFLLTFLFGSVEVFAQAAPASPTSGMGNNMLLWLMLTLIFILFIFIVVLAEVLKKAGYFYIKTKSEEKNNAGKVLSILMAIMILPALSFAQEPVPAVQETSLNYGGISSTLFWGLFVVICFEVLVVLVMIIILKQFLAVAAGPEPVAEVKVVEAPKTSRIWDKINDSVEIDHEERITMDHNYDGIRELDNSLPPWWKYGFYLTIVFAVIYLIHFHVTKTGDLSAQEYNNEVAKAQADIAAYMKTSANNVDESNVKYLDAADALKSGAGIYQANCAACHGKFGEGVVGPNLTDDYWIHGGGMVDIFKTVKYGFSERGMKAWKDDLSPMQMAEVSSYVKSLKGTNPANPKEKQGDLWVENAAPAATDSTAAQPTTDSTTTKANEAAKGKE
jgi:cytochrome c oxidase cbb3-type subunit 3